LIIHPDDRERSREAFASLIARRGTPHFENRMLCRDVSFRQLSWVAVPDREVIYAVGRDISALKQTQEQLNALRRQLALVSRQTTMGAMTATIAHEVKQPLAAIVTNANAGLRWLDRRDPDLAEAREAFERIARDGHRLNEVIASVRAMFEKNSGEASLVDLSSIVDEVLALAQGELDAHQIVLRRDTSDRLPPVKAERVQLQQVFLNLIINAVEAMTTVTGRERQLLITSGLGDNGSLKVAIEDSGSGIEAGHFERIFDPFFTTKSHGMGLGLSICRSILEAHGGTLLASPRSPFGTVFRLTLPVAHAELE
jgi:signal transduction histidine kinase